MDWIITKKPRPPLERWIRDYVVGKGNYAAHSHEEYLLDFMKFCGKEIYDIKIEDVKLFRLHLQQKYNTEFSVNRAIMAVNCFLRYWRFRGHKYLPHLHAARE